ncbi:MAG: HAD family hydrolase [Salinigranum sp.]
MVTSFDLFGTLVDVPRPDDPAAAVAAELRNREVTVPGDWSVAYGERHLDVPEGAELPLSAHVAAALKSRGVDPMDGDEYGNVVRRAVVAAFDPADVATRPGAVAAVSAAAEGGPVAVLSNCSVPELPRRALRRSALEVDAFEAVVSSLSCGWRKPDRRAFAAVADRFDAPMADLVHVGDDPEADGGADAAGARCILTSETPLEAVPDLLEAER